MMEETINRLADDEQIILDAPDAADYKQMVAALYRELENELLDKGPIKFSDGWVPVTEERLNIAFERVMQQYAPARETVA